MYLSHNLLGPIGVAAKKRMEAFSSQTFWGNAAALKVQMAMLVLALAGRNVDRAWWSIGSGGVGQSLNSHHIAQLFQSYHCFLDMDIFFDDDELREQ